jgi:hypothetical protein
VAVEGVAGEGHDGDLAGALVLLETSRRLPAVDAREGEVHQDEVRDQIERLVERLVPVRGFFHAESGEPQVGGVHLPAIVEIVHHEDQGGLRARLLFS